ncbi:MAG: CPBP family intramembrane metalloprotease [Peptococcaceae bacterium]|nr:MAG: CPBP family intramembrane metalloprotease [Peptococcaceae bacterium]
MPAGRAAAKRQNWLRNRNIAWLWFYCLGVTGAELCTGLVSVRAGMWLHILLLSCLLLHAALTYRHSAGRLYLALCMAPLIRILSLALPLAGTAVIYWYAWISIPLFIGTAVLIRLLGLKLGEVGIIPGKWPVQATVGLLGAPLGLIEYFILRPRPLIQTPGWLEMLVPAVVLLVCTGFLEELIFRGVLYRVATEAVGKRFGLFYSSFVFASLHITHLSWLDVLFVLGVAVTFAWVVGRYRSITGVSLAHGVTNIGLYLVWPFFQAEMAEIYESFSFL